MKTIANFPSPEKQELSPKFLANKDENSSKKSSSFQAQILVF